MDGIPRSRPNQTSIIMHDKFGVKIEVCDGGHWLVVMKDRGGLGT